MVAGQKSIWNELHVPARRNVVESADRLKLLGNAFDALGDIRPVVVFAFAENHAVQRDTPGLLRCVRKAQALERNRQPDDIPVRGKTAFTFPNGVKTEIVRLAFGVNGIGLNAQGIGIKNVRAMMILKSVQVDSDTVVLADVFAFGKMSAYLARSVMAHKNGV